MADILANILQGGLISPKGRLSPTCGPKRYKNSPQYKAAKRKSLKPTASTTKKSTSKKRSKSKSSDGDTMTTTTTTITTTTKRRRSTSKKKKSKKTFTLEEEIESLGDLASYKIPENLLGREGKEGATYEVYSSLTNKSYAMKAFRPTKSATKISQEAELQKEAASLGVAPRILTYSGSSRNKYILMDKLTHRLSDLAKSKSQNNQLTTEQQEGIIECAEKLDQLEILHNDGNALNLMTDDDGRIYYIDYGFSKYINKKLLKKYGPHVNGCLTISMLVRSFRHHGISAPLLVKYVAECKAAAARK